MPLSLRPGAVGASTTEGRTLIPASYAGGKGSDLAHFRVPKELTILIERLQAKDPHRFPTVTDVWRLAAKVGADVLEAETSPLSSLAILDASSAIIENDLIRERGSEQVDKLCAAVNDLKGRGLAGGTEAQSLVDRVVTDFTRISNPFWRDELLQLIDHRVRPLLQPGVRRGLSLVAFVQQPTAAME
jgi:hypothetical protein